MPSNLKYLLKTFHSQCKLVVGVLFLWFNSHAQQISNYVANGSFEEYYICNGPPSYPLTNVKHWLSIDSTNFGGVWFSVCNLMVPGNSDRYQYPKTGSAYIGSTLFELNSNRGYLKNRLKSTLKSGKTYCVRFYISIVNGSTYGMDGFGAYFGNNSIDTITKCTLPLTYLVPQVKNPIGNIITDTLHWVPITGTFVANGTEKYMLIGNFIPNDEVDTLQINPIHLPTVFTDVLIDDVSCIDIDLPAYAGPDQPLIAGDSVYIGRELDFAVDSACTWYQLPNITTPIKKASGLWVKPVTTTTYVVKQEIYCGTTKWDTVVVFMTATGIKSMNEIEDQIKMYPNPAQDELSITCPDKDLNTLFIYNNLGQLLREEEISFTHETASINTADLANGSYLLRLSMKQTDKNSNNRTITKKLLIAK